MAEREIKTVLTLEDASFSKGLKAAASNVKAAQAEMNAAISSAGGLGKGFKQAAAQVTGLSKILKEQKGQMGVLSKEYKKQKEALKEAQKAMEAVRKENGAGSDEAEKAENAYAAQAAQVNDLRVKMANLTVEMNKNKGALKNTLTAPLRAAGNMLKSFGKIAVAAMAAGGAALVKFTADSNESKKNFKGALRSSQDTFGEFSLFIEAEAKKAWESLGLSQSAYMQHATDIGKNLQEAGMNVQQSAEWVKEAMDLAGQLSDAYGKPVEEVLGAIADAASGNTEALKDYGVQVENINKTMTDGEKAASTLRQAMESAKEIANALDEEVAESTERSGEKLKSAWENFKAGVGNAEDVAAAASEAASAFASDFADNAALMIEIAPDFFDSFVSSFNEGWNTKVWPKVQDLFKTKFHIDLPEWSEIADTIKTTLKAVHDAIAGLTEIALNIVVTPISAVVSAVSSVWDAVSGWWESNVRPLFVNVQQNMDNFPENAADKFRFYPNSFAGGLWNVPKNDYMARLHSGEMVLTADAARRYRAQVAAAQAAPTYNESSNLYIGNYYQRNDTDVQGLLNQMQFIQRKRRSGYGQG